MRLFTSIAIGLLLAAMFIACAIDPNPPHPHGDAGRSDEFLHSDGGGGSGGGGSGAGNGGADGGEADQ
jgi:hypothetical protein